MYSKRKVPPLLLALMAVPVALAGCAKYHGTGSVVSTA
jgi:hypothetical protein